jgi:hypothetical protein
VPLGRGYDFHQAAFTQLKGPLYALKPATRPLMKS